MTRTEVDTQRILAALEGITAGASSAQLAAAAGISTARARTVLKTAHKAGLVRCLRVLLGAVWFLPAQEATVRAGVKAERDQRAAVRYRTLYAKHIRAAELVAAGQVEAMADLPPSVHRIVAMAHSGATALQLAQDSGISVARVQTILFLAGRAGLLVKVPCGRRPLWMPPAAAAERAKPAKQRVQPPPPDVDSDPIVQRVGVRADAPMPFVCRAPASVFHLGAGL